MSDVLGMTATEYALSQRCARLEAENESLKAMRGPDNIYAASSLPTVTQMRVCTQQLNVAVRTYCRDDGYGYHVIGEAYSGLHVAYYVDRTALARMSNWAMADMMKQQLEQVTKALIQSLIDQDGVPSAKLHNLDHSPATQGSNDASR